MQCDKCHNLMTSNDPKCTTCLFMSNYSEKEDKDLERMII